MKVISGRYQKPGKAWVCLVIAVLGVLLLSGNRAWVHHRVMDGELWVLDYPPQLPFMWQYDTDANMQLGSTAFFPDYYKLQPMFVDRPGMHAAGYMLGKLVGVVLDPLYESEWFNNIRNTGVSLVEKSDLNVLLEKTALNSTDAVHALKSYLNAAAGLILFKLIMYSIALIMLYQLIGRYLDPEYAMFSSLWFLFSSYSFNGIGIYHTYEFQILTPVIIVFLFAELLRKYTTQRNIGFSILVGLLMLVKPNYAAYIAALCFAAIYLRDCGVNIVTGLIVSITAHLIPWILWHSYLEVHEMGLFGLFSELSLQGKAAPLNPVSILFNEFVMTDLERLEASIDAGLPGGGGPTMLQTEFSLGDQGGILGAIKLVISHIQKTLLVFSGPVVILGVIGGTLVAKNTDRRIVVFTLLIIGAAWLQAFIAFPFSFYSRTVKDPLFLFYAFAGYALLKLAPGYLSVSKKKLCVGILTVQLLVSVMSQVRTPWIHPFDQHGEYSYQKSGTGTPWRTA